MDSVPGHNIDLGPENILQALLYGHEVEKGKAIWTFQVKKYINVGFRLSLIARDRAKKIQRSDTGVVKLRLMCPQ